MYAIVDCNNFFASCERLFRPELEGKPIVVLSNNDGCVIARSAEAKKLGVKMGVPFFEVRDLARQHGIHVFSSNYALYGDLSQRMMLTLQELVNEVEQYSIDEAFLHLPEIPVSGLEDYARYVKETAGQWTGIPVSIGVAPTKTLSKIANRVAKKYAGYKGVFVLDTPERTEKVLAATTVEDVWGIGGRLARKLSGYGVYTALQLRDMNERLARQIMGVTGLRTVHELRGLPCHFNDAVPEVRKGILSSRSFGQPVTELEDLREAVATFLSRAAVKLRRQGSVASALGVFLYTEKAPSSRGFAPSDTVQLPVATDHTGELIGQALRLTERIFRKDTVYKKAGVMLSGLSPKESIQLNAFNPVNRSRHAQLMETFDKINRRMGNGTVSFAISSIGKNGEQKNWLMRSEKRSPCYTTKWEDLPVVS